MFQIYTRVASFKIVSYAAVVVNEDEFQSNSFQKWFQFVQMEVERWALMGNVCKFVYFVIFSNIVIFNFEEDSRRRRVATQTKPALTLSAHSQPYETCCCFVHVLCNDKYTDSPKPYSKCRLIYRVAIVRDSVNPGCRRSSKE